jgi:hypothetical protein
MKELQTYICHKRVQAFKIEVIILDADMARDEGRETTGGASLSNDQVMVRVDVAYMRRCNPEVGGYYVRYADGYESYSPAKAFEEGYTIQGDNIYEKGWRAGWDGANKEVIKVLDKLKAIRERHHG